MTKFLRKYFLAGLLFWVPLGFTIFIIKILIDLLDKSIILLPHQWRPEVLIGYDVPGFGVALAIIIVLFTGFVVANWIGRRLLRWGESILDHIPLVSTIYSAIKQVTTTILSTDNKSFKEVIMIQYPRKGLWTLAFATGKATKEMREKTEENLVITFVPTTPNPTSGFIIMVPEADVVRLDIDVQDALKMIMSLGVINPDSMQKHIIDGQGQPINHQPSNKQEISTEKTK